MTQHDVTPLLDVAAGSLVDLSPQTPRAGHWPSWLYAQIPDGLALCLGCWRAIEPSQLGVEACAGAAALVDRLLPTSPIA